MALEGLARALAIEEGVHSTAMEHPARCECIICDAASGDMEAMTAIYEDLL